MQNFRNAHSIALGLTVALLALVGICPAQDGVSTAGAARSRYLGNMGLLPKAREVVVEDFVNYHRHEIGRPKAGEAVGLDVRWGSQSLADNGEAVLQVGLSTGLANDRKQLRPLNLSIVIDKSGSMADDNKLVRVKEALIKLVSQLRPTDVLSIVVFDSDAQVLLPARRVSDHEGIDRLIREIEPGSSTNLNGGLMLGYKEALKNYRKDSTNRVILLTDGIANRGITDPRQIAQASASYNDQGIDLTTIGVGLDLNKDLLQTLAKSGHGLFHFIADSQDIEKVFVKELQSQISPVATDAKVEVRYGSALRLAQVYGFQPNFGDKTVKVNLDNMNSGMTEVVLLRFMSRGETENRAHLPVTVKLTYYDLDREKTVETTQETSVALVAGPQPSTMEDSSVAKNYAIASLAQAMHRMADDCEQNRMTLAKTTLDNAILKTSRSYPNMDDEDIKRTMDIALKYQAILHQNVRDNRNIEDRDVAPASNSVFGNLIPNGSFALGNTGFSSPDLAYIQPADNCLWPMGYTIAPTFNNPQLHRLVPGEEYAAPKRTNGNEQVYFANAGGADSMVILSTTVRCKPNTLYHLSFHAVSLSGGPEWTPTFELRVNGDRSEPQAAGTGTYAGVGMQWESKNARIATISIVRMPIPHGGGLIGIANLEMMLVR